MLIHDLGFRALAPAEEQRYWRKWQLSTPVQPNNLSLRFSMRIH